MSLTEQNPFSTSEKISSFQSRVYPWLVACFEQKVVSDKIERGDRLLEEVLELLQAADYPKQRVGAIANYVWHRPAGNLKQELGGVMMSLAAFSQVHCVDMHHAGEVELGRAWERIDQIRLKQDVKPSGNELMRVWSWVVNCDLGE